MTHPLRLGVIGAGTITQSVHLESARRAGFELTWVCDLSPSRAVEVARRTGSAATTDPADVYGAGDVDAVLIATPGSHASVAVQALQAGKHVLIEKPVALSESGIRAVVDASTRSGLVAQVGYMKMYDPILPAAREAIAELDGVRLVRVTVQHPADEPQVGHLRMAEPPGDADSAVIAQSEAAEEAEVAQELPWATPALRRYYRGVLNGSVIHEFSLLRALGLPLPLEWDAQVFPDMEGNDPACLLATAAPDGDIRYVLSWNWLPDLPRYQEEVAVLASNGSVAIDMARPYLLEEASRLRVVGHRAGGRCESTIDGPAETGFLRQLDHFAVCINNGDTPVALVEDALQDVRQTRLIAEGIGRSLGLGVSGDEGRE